MTTLRFPLLKTVACQDGLHSFCDATGMDYERREVECQCPHHRGEHITDAADPLACWCGPYSDREQPSVIVHRREGMA